MSRVGKLPINIPSAVQVSIDGLSVVVSGPKGSLNKTFKGEIAFAIDGEQFWVRPLTDSKLARAMWGTARSVINNMICGVKELFVQELEVNGVGYRASVSGKYLNLSLGKSHNTKIEIPGSVIVETPKQNIVLLSSCDKEVLGQFASVIIKQRPPEPYKGKGIKRKGQYVQRKEGKKG